MSLNWQFLRAKVWLLLALGQRDAALRVLADMNRLRPEDPYAWASRAHLRAMAGAHAEAVPDLQRAAELEPQNAGHWFNLGFVLAQLERHEHAVAAFRKSTEQDAKLDRAWYGLGLSLLQIDRLDEAIQAFKRNTELQPMSPYGWTQLARSHVRAQQPGKARKVVEHLRNFEPKVAEALTRELKLESQENPA